MLQRINWMGSIPFFCCRSLLNWMREKTRACKSIGIYIGLNWKQYCDLNKWLLMLSFMFNWKPFKKTLHNSIPKLLWSQSLCADCIWIFAIDMVNHVLLMFNLRSYRSWSWNSDLMCRTETPISHKVLWKEHLVFLILFMFMSHDVVQWTMKNESGKMFTEFPF